jgi:hypothetical protein
MLEAPSNNALKLTKRRWLEWARFVAWSTVFRTHPPPLENARRLKRRWTSSSGIQSERGLWRQSGSCFSSGRLPEGVLAQPHGRVPSQASRGRPMDSGNGTRKQEDTTSVRISSLSIRRWQPSASSASSSSLRGRGARDQCVQGSLEGRRCTCRLVSFSAAESKRRR